MLGARALVVVAPAGREVAVEVDAVGRRERPVAVVVAQVLAPEAVLGVEGVVVAVGVGDQDEPQLAGLDERVSSLDETPCDGLVVGADGRALAPVVVQEHAQRAAAGLAGEPFASVLGRRIQDRGPLAVADLRSVLRHLHRVDRDAVQRLADGLQLRDVGVAAREALKLRLQVCGGVAGRAGDRDVGARVRAPDLPPVGCLRGCNTAWRYGRGGCATAWPHAGLAQLRDLAAGADDLDRPGAPSLVDVVTLCLQSP